MTRYTIKHADAAKTGDWCVMTTFATVEAETPDDARAAFAAAHPGRAILEIAPQGDPDEAFTRYGLGAWTDTEWEAYRASFQLRADRRRAEDEKVRQAVSEYTLAELAAELAYSERRASETTPNADGVHVGDLFYSSWGYDQTNIDFYEVVGLRGKKTALIRRCPSKSEQTGDMTGGKRPIRCKVYGDTYTVKTKINDYTHQPAMRDPYLEGRHHLSPVEPGKLYGFSTYA